MFNATMKRDWRCSLWAVGLASAVLISGCGGGGGTSETTPPPPTAGTLDSSFGTGGTVITPIGVSAHATSVVLQFDGKIVAAGYATPDMYQLNLVLARYNLDGTLDSAFGSAGIAAVVGLESAASYPSAAVTLQPDGKIVAAGVSHKGTPATAYCTLARFNSGGAIDATFGVDGIVTTQIANAPPDTACDAVALQPDGKIVAAAAATVDFGKLGVIRFNADGTRDPSFGTGGEAVVSTKYAAAYASAIVVQPDGKIIVGGGSGAFGGTPGSPFIGEFQLVRFDAAGVLDTAFGQGGTVHGTVSNNPSPQLGAVVLQPDGKIVVVVVGDVLRFLANGTPDLSFGVGGAVADIRGYAGALQSNGKIVIAGTVAASPTAQSFAVWRLDANGLLDSGFGNGGSVSTPIGTTATALAVAIQPNGRIVAAGQADTASRFPGDSLPTRPNLALARYFGDASSP